MRWKSDQARTRKNVICVWCATWRGEHRATSRHVVCFVLCGVWCVVCGVWCGVVWCVWCGVWCGVVCVVWCGCMFCGCGCGWWQWSVVVVCCSVLLRNVYRVLCIIVVWDVRQCCRQRVGCWVVSEKRDLTSMQTHYDVCAPAGICTAPAPAQTW